MAEGICTVEDCASPSKARGLCQNHYMRLRRHGDPLGVAEPRADRGCTVEGCEAAHKAKGLCAAHYQQRWNGRDVTPELRNKQQVCKFPGCTNPRHGAGLCGGHWRQQRDGRALAPLRDRQTPGGECSVESCSKPAVHLGLCNRHYQRKSAGEPDWDRPLRAKAAPGSGTLTYGYRRVYVDGRLQAEHRLVMEGILGRPLLPQENVHHLNGARSDNRPENLELWTKAQPAGQRVEDKVTFAIEMLTLYRPDLLAST